MTPKSLLDFPTVKAYLSRINAEERSLMRAVVKQEHGNGYYTDLALIKFTKQGEVVSPQGYEPTEKEQQGIQFEMSSATWPEVVLIPANDPDLPDKAKNADPEDLYWFRDINGNVLMGQVRRVNADGTKNYFPLTKWSDGEYRWVEPEGQLPLFGIEQLKEHSTVFIHEGCRSAIYAQKIANGEIDHPWATELSHAAHLAYIGGALAPHRTDWKVLQKHGVSRVIIVADNDEAGKTAIPKISRELYCTTLAVEFTDQFKKAGDIADPFPDSMFKELGDTRYYTGPTFRECVHPATWMTDIIPFVDEKGKAKKCQKLRPHVKSQWAYIETLEIFVHTEFPEISYKAVPLDAMLSPFSDVRRTSELLLQSFNGRTPKLTYRPDLPGKRRVISNGENAINVYVPPSVKPQEGDPTPWIKYVQYLIPDEKEAYEFQRWCATLIARPDIRMSYAVLLVSNETGIGKSTIGERVLAPLIGVWNCTFPSESDIVDSSFNSWLKGKRLAVANEIYAGSSFRAANKVKSLITDKFVEINEKFMTPIRMENYIHILACSNSERALMLDEKDRRWFCPTVSETKWDRSEFEKFFSWLESGGLPIIAHWANTFGDYIQAGDRAPMTDRKMSIIDESRSMPEREVISLAETIIDQDIDVAIPSQALFIWATRDEKGKVHDKPLQFQKICKSMGFEIWNGKDRVFVDGRLQPVIISPKLNDRLLTMDSEEAKSMVKERVKLPGAILNMENGL